MEITHFKTQNAVAEGEMNTRMYNNIPETSRK